MREVDELAVEKRALLSKLKMTAMHPRIEEDGGDGEVSEVY